MDVLLLFITSIIKNSNYINIYKSSKMLLICCFVIVRQPQQG